MGLSVAGGSFSRVYAQTPAAPPSESGQQPTQEQQPSQPPPAPSPEQQPIPQVPIQQPGRPPLTPGLPPSTTLPPWTPPVAPAPSQTNIPAPFGPGAPGVPGGPGAFSTPGFAGGAIPGAFTPTIARVGGATLEFHPTLRAAEEYSDNFFQTSSHAEDNFRSILGPGFSLLLNGARTFGTVNTTVDLVHDTAPNSGDDLKVFPSLFAAVRYALTPRLSLTLDDRFIRSDTATTLDPSGIRRGRSISDTNTFTSTVDWIVGQIATQAYYRNVLFFNEDNQTRGTTTSGFNSGDSITHIVGVNAGARILTDYIVRGGYEFSSSDETDNRGSNSNIGRDSTSHTVFGSAARQFGLFTTAGVSSSYSIQTLDDTRIWNASLFGSYGIPQGLSLAGSVGYSILNSDTQDNEGLISANLTATYRFARAAISAGVAQDFRQTAQQGQNFGTVETRSYFASFLYQITPFINAVVQATYAENEPTGTGNINNNQTQKTLSYGGSVNWQVLRWLTASVQYLYTKQSGGTAFNQDAVFGTGDYAENRATLNLFATF